MGINERIAELLVIKKIDQKTLALEIGVTPAAINKVIKGNGTPGSKVLMSILSVYSDISAEWLMRGEGEVFRNGESAGKVQKTKSIVEEMKDIKARLDKLEKPKK